jgi:hypothetical protein
MKDKKNAKAMWLETESPPLYLWEKQQASLASKDIPWDIAGSHEELRFNYEVGSLAPLYGLATWWTVSRSESISRVLPSSWPLSRIGARGMEVS